MVSANLRRAVGGVAAGILALAMSAQGAVNPDLSAVLMPGADIAVSVNLAKMRGAPIILKMKELGDMKEAMGGQGPDMEGMKEFAKKMQAVTGLEEDDCITLMGAAKLDGIDFESGRKPDMGTVDAVMAMEFTKTLSDDRLEAGLKTLVAQTAEERALDTVPAVVRSTYNGTTLFTGANPDNPEEKIAFAMIGGGKIMLMGSETGLKGAVDRGKGGKTNSLAGLFPATLVSNVSGKDVAVLFQPTPEITAKMKSNAEAAAANPAKAMRAMAAQAFAELAGFGFGMAAGNSLEVNWIGDFGSEPVAQQVKGMLDNSVISGIKMLATMMTGGQPLPMLNSLKANAAANGTAGLSFAIAEQDLTMLKQVAEQRKQQAAEGMMPPVPMEE